MADEPEVQPDPGGPPSPAPPPAARPPEPPGPLPPYPGTGAVYGQPPPGYAPPGPYQQPGYQPPYQPPPGYAPPNYPPGGYGAPGYGYGYRPGGPLGPGGRALASYWARLGGWLIDFVIIGVIVFGIDRILNAGHVAWVTFHYSTTVNGVTDHHVGHFSVLSPIVQIVVVVLYGALLCGSARGQTIGMMAVGAKAVDGETGQPIGIARGLGRALFEYLLFIVLFVPWVIDMLFPAWDRRRQTLHDKVSRTVVVKAQG